MKNENRLKKRKHFNYIYKNGEVSFSNFVKLVYLKSKLSTFKVGFSVNKKIGKSVIRNKVKRRLKEAFFELSKEVKPYYNYIIVAKTGIENLSYQEIQKQLEKVLVKANLINEKNS